MTNLRLTPQRRAVLDVIIHSHDHPSAGEIYQRVLETLPGIAYATVYNAINYLIDKRLVHELTFGDRASRYDGNTTPHHHGCCENCEKIFDVSVKLAHSASEIVEEHPNFHVTGYHILFRGICRDCKDQQVVN